MSDFFGKLMTKISAVAGFPLMVYVSETKTMLRYNGNSVETISVPPIIAANIDKDDIVFENKTIGEKNLLIYFFRWTFGGKNYVIVINDLYSRVKLGRFFNVLSAILRDIQGNRDILAERARILKDSLDEKIVAREKAILDLKICENQINEALDAKNIAIAELKSFTEENALLKTSILHKEETVRQIENALLEKNNAVAHLQNIVKEKDDTVKNLQRSMANIQNVRSEEYENKIRQLLKVRNEAIIRLKAQISENDKLKTTVSTVEDAVKRLEQSVRAKENTINIMRQEFEEKLKNSASIPKEYEEKLKKVLEVRNAAVSRLKSLMEENERLKAAPGVSEETLLHLRQMVKNKDNEISQLTQVIQEKNEIVKAKDAKISKTRFYLEEMTELVKVVKKSRDKIMTLTDFITVPMYSVSGERTLVHANNALASYVKSPNVAKIVGKSCHKLIFGFDEPCPWCQLEKVQKTGASTTVGVIVNEDGRRKNIELTLFPILDSTGTLIDCGEFIVDKTDTFELAQSLKKFKEQVITFKRAKISGMNEIQDVKKAYDELSANYDLVVARNNKLSQALESLLTQDNNKEVISAKNETAEYKAALHRSNGIIDNYKKNLEDLQSRYSTLNKQTFSQMERLINVVRGKQNIDVKDIGNMLASIGIDFAEISKILGK